MNIWIKSEPQIVSHEFDVFIYWVGENCNPSRFLFSLGSDVTWEV